MIEMVGVVLLGMVVLGALFSKDAPCVCKCECKCK